MQYILVEIEGYGPAYQVVYRGSVVRYAGLDGTTLFDFIPTGHSSFVLDANPPLPAWHVIPIEEPYVPPAPVLRRLSKLDFIGRIGGEFRNILAAAKVSVDVEMFVRMLDWATADADGTSIDLDDPRVVYAMKTMEAGGLIAEGRAAEILSA